LLAAVEDAPAEMLQPALQLLITMYTAIIEKPNEPKVRRIRWVKCCYGVCVCVCVRARARARVWLVRVCVRV
jgi:hypothetical protein